MSDGSVSTQESARQVPRVWFNRHFSTVERVLRLLRSAPDPLPMWTLVSHRHEDFSGFSAADQALIEPSDIEPEAYLKWCLDVVTEYQITHLVPGHEQSFLCIHSADFAARGCGVIHAAPARILPDMHRKDWVYEQIKDRVPVPEFVVVHDIEQAMAAIDQMRASHEVCVKPSVSVYGKGFYRLIAEGSTAAYVDTIAGWETRMRARDSFPAHLVMEHLSGLEYSVDIAAHCGSVIAAVVRCKSPGTKYQLLVDRSDLVAHAEVLVNRFEASGLLNVQFKENANGKAALLEINPRASGGIGMSCQSGLNLPDLAFRAVLRPGAVTAALPGRCGIRVAEVSVAVTLPVPEEFAWKPHRA